MRTLIGFSLALVLAASISAQSRGAVGNPQPTVQGSFGSILFPGGTRATTPGIQRSFGSVLFPGGGGPRLNVPGSVNDPTFLSRPGLGSGFARPGRQGRPGFGQNGSHRATVIGIPYAVPVYGGGFYDNPYLPGSDAAAAPQQPNITVIYPPQTAPVMVYPSSGEDSQAAGAPLQIYQAPITQPADDAATSAQSTQPQYLIAFKDHTIYSAIAYWVDGDTLHYFTSGNTHNQVSLSLVDKALTERLNRESGVDLRLP
jgi:hypothetical protein